MSRLRVSASLFIALAVLLGNQPLLASDDKPPEVVWIADTTDCPTIDIKEEWGRDDREPYAFRVGGQVKEPVLRSSSHPLDNEKYRQCMGPVYELHVMELLVNKEGIVEAIALRRGPKNCWVDELVRHYRSFEFEPAKLDGSPVCITYPIVVRVGLQ